MTREEFAGIRDHLVRSYNALQPNHRKCLWFGIAIVLVVGYLMLPDLSSLRPRQMRPVRRTPIRHVVPQKFAATPPPRLPSLEKASPASPLETQAAPVEPAPPVVSTDKLAGTWVGSVTSADGNVCSLKLELHPDQPAHVTAYSTLTCVSLAPIISAQARKSVKAAVDMMNRNVPTAGILSGAQDPDGTIRLNIEKFIGPPRDQGGCTSFVLTPFGAQIVAEWKGDSCHAGQVMLRKVSS